jgi:hypothetical protein
MPGWLLPWVVPVAMAVAVMLTAASSIVADVVLVVIGVVCLAGLAALRVRYLEEHPPDPELVHKPFWKF